MLNFHLQIGTRISFEELVNIFNITGRKPPEGQHLYLDRHEDFKYHLARYLATQRVS